MESTKKDTYANVRKRIEDIENLKKELKEAKNADANILIVDMKRWLPNPDAADYLKDFKVYRAAEKAPEPPFNIWKVPYGVDPREWSHTIVDVYCYAYGLFERANKMLTSVVDELYIESGVYDAYDNENMRFAAPGLSAKICFRNIYFRMCEKLEDEIKEPTTRDTKDAYARIIERLSCFSRDFSPESVFGKASITGIEDVFIDDDVREMTGRDKKIAIDVSGLESPFTDFLYNVILALLYKCKTASDAGCFKSRWITVFENPWKEAFRTFGEDMYFEKIFASAEDCGLHIII